MIENTVLTWFLLRRGGMGAHRARLSSWKAALPLDVRRALEPNERVHERRAELCGDGAS